MKSKSIYQELAMFMKLKNITYREVLHAAEGSCEAVSKLRGNQVSQAAKAMLVMVSYGKRGKKYYLAVVPGDQQINFEAIKKHTKGDSARFAPKEKIAELTYSEIGTVPPFSFNPEVKVIVDPTLYDNEEIVFNAGRLDCSFFIKASDHKQYAEADIISIIKKVSVVEQKPEKTPELKFGEIGKSGWGTPNNLFPSKEEKKVDPVTTIEPKESNFII